MTNGKDYMQNFLAELSSKNFTLTQVELDGSIHRFDRNGSKGNAWYIGWQNHSVKTGIAYIVAEYGDWKTSERHLYKPDSSILSTADQQAIKTQLEEAKKKSEEEKKARQNEAAIKAEKYFSSAQVSGSTTYMQKKNINQLYGAKIYNGVLQIPVRDIHGKLWGLQYISDESKRFLSGSKVDSCFHTIGESLKEGFTGTVFLAEGFATGSSIFQATGKTVIIAFNAGNLVSVARILRDTYKEIEIIVCGDDDRFTVINGDQINNGRIKAEKAGLLAHAKVIFPVFESDEGKPTDFNDLHCREGIEKVKEQILNDDSEPKAGFIPIGYDEGNFFFFHVPTKDIVRANSFTKSQLFQIAPAEYWADKYPATRADADLSAAVNDLIQMSKKIGPFDSTRIRGTGVWLDQGRIVINLGSSLVVDGKEMNISSFKSWFIYIQTKNRLPKMAKPLRVDECKILLDACGSLKWRDPKSEYLLAGWLVVARIAGALPIRPHVWLTGGSGTGKSTVMDKLIAPGLGCQKGKIYLQGSSTEAGIRQRIKCSSVPTIFDEFETTGEGSKERVGNLVELLRNTWSATQGSVVKGSATGQSIEYNLQFTALVSSIRVNLDNDADRSRFSILELAPHNNDLVHWQFVKSLLKQVNEHFGERLFSRACSMVNIIRASQDRISDALAGFINQRYGQQVGTLLAGWWALTSDEIISNDSAKYLVQDLDLCEELAESKLTDELECFNYLMSWKIMVRNTMMSGGTECREISIGDALQTGFVDQVKTYGIKIDNDRILVADKHAELSKIYSKTRWQNWNLSLRRIEGAIKSNPTRFAGILSRATSLPISLIKELKL